MARDDDDDAMRETISPLTDDEAELFRFLRFGQLPETVKPADMIAEVDTRHLQPTDPAAEDRQRIWYAGN